MSELRIIRFLGELLRSRALIAALVRRNLAVRYRGSSLGVIWTILNPLLLMAVYTLVFKFYLRFDSVAYYPIFVFCGLLPWIWFTQSVSESAMSISGSGHLVTKSLFPPQVLSVVPVLAGAVNFLLSIPVLIVMALLLGFHLQLTMLLLPLIVLLQITFAMGIGFMVAALNVPFRDVQHIVGHVLSLIFFLTPIVYPASQVPASFAWVLQLNPLAVFIGMYHDVLYSGVVPGLTSWVIAVAAALVMLIIGIATFESHREDFAELL